MRDGFLQLLCERRASDDVITVRVDGGNQVTESGMLCASGTVIVQGIFTERALVRMLGFVTRETMMIGINFIILVAP
jgi:hypothetical protein